MKTFLLKLSLIAGSAFCFLVVFADRLRTMVRGPAGTQDTGTQAHAAVAGAQAAQTVRAAETAAAVAVVEKEAEAMKATDSVDLANKIIAGSDK